MGNITTPLRARPTIYRGIEMRSRLEASWAAEFDEMTAAEGMKWEYEPVCFASGKIQYLPDFRLWWPDTPKAYVYVEIRPGNFSEPESTMRKMEAILDCRSETDEESDGWVNLWLIAGSPSEDYKKWECCRYHPLFWYEWSNQSENVPYFERQVPMPKWFSEWRERPENHERWT